MFVALVTDAGNTATALITELDPAGVAGSTTLRSCQLERAVFDL